MTAAPLGGPSGEALAAECGACHRCGLAATRQQVVVGRGDPTARLLLVGEAPGAEEEACGQPFVGRSGRLLEAMLAAAGLNSERDLYIANVIKCRPPGNRKPSRAEIEACRPWLERQIALVRPQLVLLVGATALEALLGIRGGITKLRGRWLQLEKSQGPDQPAPNQVIQRRFTPSKQAEDKRKQSPRSPIRWPDQSEEGIALMPLLHPSYLLRNPSEAEGSPRWLTRADLVAVRDRLMMLEHKKDCESKVLNPLIPNC
jgi:DNA polymerase